MGAQVPGRTIGADPRVAFVLPVALPIGCGITQNRIFWANYAVIVFAIDMAKIIGAPFAAFLYRLKDLGILQRHDISEYIVGELGIETGGDS